MLTDSLPNATVPSLTLANAGATGDPLRDKLLSLLAADVSASSAALACGCTDSYVSQLLQDEDFSRRLVILRSVKLERALAHDEKLEAVESKALAQVAAKLPFTRGPLEAARIYQILNNAKKHATPGTGADATGAQQVTIVLPRAAAVQIQLNSSNQVIDVNGRSMAPLPSRALPAIAAENEQKRKDAARATALLNAISTDTVTINGVERVI
jgi:hypothetical protein